MPSLLYSYALGKVPRLIDITASKHGDMIGEKLKWNSEDNGVEIAVASLHEKRVTRQLGNGFMTCGGQREQDAASAIDFLHVGQDLFKEAA